MSESFQGTVIRGALAHLLTSTPAKLLGFALTILAAQTLSPGLYGEFNLAVTIYGISDLLTNPSVFTYFVRTPEAPEKSLNSAFTFSLLRGVVLTGIFWLLATPLAAAFDGGPGVVVLLQLLSTTFFIASVRNPWVVSVYHGLEYRKMALIESVGALVGNIAGIVLLLIYENPAALATGVIVNQIVGCILTWVYADRAPKFAFDVKELITVWNFSRFLLINNIIIFLLLQLDDVFIAKLAGLELLGIYALAFKVANDSVLFLIATLRQVLLPAFVRLVSDREKLARATLRAVGTLSALSWILASATFAIANELMLIISPDPEWRGSELVLMALMPFVLVRAVNGVYGSVLVAVGEPQVLSRVAGFQLACMIPLMWLGYEVGLGIRGSEMDGVLGVTLAIAILNLLTNNVLMVHCHREHDIPGWKGFGLMWLLAPVCVPAAGVATWLKDPTWNPWFGAAVGALTVLLIALPAWELLVRGLKLGELVDSPSKLIQRAISR